MQLDALSQGGVNSSFGGISLTTFTHSTGLEALENLIL